MLGPGQWPENGEIDIMEDVNALSELSGTVHCGTDPGGPCNEPDGIGSGLQSCSGCQTGYHTYTMILNRTNTSDESITFYLDGNQYFTVTESQVGTVDLAGGVRPQPVDHLRPGHGRRLPERRLRLHLADQLDDFRRHDERGLRRGVRRPPAAAAAGGRGTGTTGPITGYGGLCVDVRGASTADFNPVQVYTCNGTDAQQWTVVQAGSTLQALGKCLDINGGGTADGTTVDLYDCNDTGAQVLVPQSNGELYNPQSGKCLDDTNWSTTPGTQLQIWDCTGNANQEWNLP